MSVAATIHMAGSAAMKKAVKGTKHWPHKSPAFVVRSFIWVSLGIDFLSHRDPCLSLSLFVESIECIDTRHL